MKKLVACASVLCLMFSSMSSLIFAMSREQLKLYDAAIRRNDIEESRWILESRGEIDLNEIDLNKEINDLEGRKTLFLNELLRSAYIQREQTVAEGQMKRGIFHKVRRVAEDKIQRNGSIISKTVAGGCVVFSFVKMIKDMPNGIKSIKDLAFIGPPVIGSCQEGIS